MTATIVIFFGTLTLLLLLFLFIKYGTEGIGERGTLIMVLILIGLVAVFLFGMLGAVK